MTDIKFKIQARGATEAGRRMGRTAEQVDRIIERHMGTAGDLMLKHFQKKAPKDTGHLRRGMTWFRTGQLTVNIAGQALDPDTGFDYFPISRFGHQTHLIRPIHHFMGAGILRWEVGSNSPFGDVGNIVWSTYSRGFHPIGDWTERGHEGAKHIAKLAGAAILRDVGKEMRR